MEGKILSKSSGGKSTILRSICVNRNKIFKTPITRVIFVYDGPQQQFADFAAKNPDVEFYRELPEISEDSVDSILVILDDYMNKSSQENNKLLNNIVTRHTHHLFKGATIISLQTFFPKNFAVASSQANVLILFPNKRNWKSVEYLSQQIFPDSRHFLKSALQDVAKKQFGFLVVDVENLESGGVRNFLWPTMDEKVYFPSA